MGNKEKILQSENKSEAQLQDERTISDAEAIHKGAGYEQNVGIRFTEEQIWEAKKEMKYEQNPRYRAYIDWESFRIRVNDLIILTEKESGFDFEVISKMFFDLKDEILKFERKYRFGYGPGHGGTDREFADATEIFRDKKMKQSRKEKEIRIAFENIKKTMILIATGMDVVQRIS